MMLDSRTFVGDASSVSRGLVVKPINFEEIRSPFAGRALGETAISELAPGVFGVQVLRAGVAHFRDEISVALSHKFGNAASHIGREG